MRASELLQIFLPGFGLGDVVLFRVDAGRERGLSYGHLMRCAVLARVLEQAGCAAKFVMERTDEGMDYARSIGLEVEAYAPSRFMDMCAEAHAVVFDLPGELPDAALYGAYDLGDRVVVIDDVNRHVPAAHVVLNSSVLACADLYPEDARLLLGPRYFFLPPEYEDAARTAGSAPGACRVLFTFGGSDPTGLTLQVLSALVGSADLGAQYTVVLGPGFGPVEQAESLCTRVSGDCRILHAPDDLLSCFLQSDIVVTSGGRTLYELHALRVPTIAVASIGHEAEAVAAFAEQGLLLAGFEQWDAALFIRVFEDAVANSMEGVDAHSGGGQKAHR